MVRIVRLHAWPHSARETAACETRARRATWACVQPRCRRSARSPSPNRTASTPERVTAGTHPNFAGPSRERAAGRIRPMPHAIPSLPPAPLATSRRSTPRSPTASPVRASSPGARSRVGSRSLASATRPTGRGPSRASAILRRASSSSGSRRRRTAATGRDACSPATPRATSLWRAMHAAGLADRPASRRADDGLDLRDARIAAAVRCAPPANRPTIEEQATCRPYLVREIELLADLRVIVALGAIGWDAALKALAALGHPTPRPKPRFAHGAEVGIGPTPSSARTTRASRTRSPAGSRHRCSRPSSSAPSRWRRPERRMRR